MAPARDTDYALQDRCGGVTEPSDAGMAASYDDLTLGRTSLTSRS